MSDNREEEERAIVAEAAHSLQSMRVMAKDLGVLEGTVLNMVKEDLSCKSYTMPKRHLINPGAKSRRLHRANKLANMLKHDNNRFNGDGGVGGFQGVGQKLLQFFGALLPFGVLIPVGLGKDTHLVGVKPSFGGMLELGNGLLDVVAQHLQGSRVREGGELVQGGLATVDPVPLGVVGVGGVGDTRVGYDFSSDEIREGLPTVRGKNKNCQKSSIRGKLMSAQRGIFARPSQCGNDISAVRGKFSPRLREGLQVCANFLRPFLWSARSQACNHTQAPHKKQPRGQNFGH